MRVAGYFRGVLGTGEHARQLAAALRMQGISIESITLQADVAPVEDYPEPAAPGAGIPDRFARFILLSVNADQVPHVAGELGRAFFKGTYTIGFWAWEVEKFPERFAPAFDFVDEVWVGSEHVRRALADAARVPVVRIPQPVSLAEESTGGRPPSGLPGGFRFLFAFDYLSVFERKNPLAVIEAFKRAFGEDRAAALIVKCLNPAHNPDAHEQLLEAAEHPAIHVVSRPLSRPDRDSLMNAADCYVSLHRAEGFGYTLAESMWLGKPVIATGYSGNADFMTAENSYPVDYRLVPIGPGQEPYPADGRWAEPDVEHAARLMRQVFERREEARSRGTRAAADIRATHGLDAAGRAMRERLESLVTSQPGRWLIQRVLGTISRLSRSR